MPRWQRVYLAACAALTGGALAAILCQYAGWPRLIYRPYQRTFIMAAPTGSALEAGFIGLSLWALAGALGGALIAVALASLAGRAVGPRAIALVGGWALTAAGLALFYSIWSLWPF